MTPIGIYPVQSVKAGKRQVSSVKVTKLTEEDDIEAFLVTWGGAYGVMNLIFPFYIQDSSFLTT